MQVQACQMDLCNPFGRVRPRILAKIQGGGTRVRSSCPRWLRSSAGLLHALLHDDFAGGFDDAAADGVAGLAKGGIVNAAALVKEISDGLADRVRERFASGVQRPHLLHDVAQAALAQGRLLRFDPGRRGNWADEVMLGDRP